ncbi:MAG: glutamate racemase [Turicibacter sp.]|nr:glutamate racemase [Turicibacter sp.]
MSYIGVFDSGLGGLTTIRAMQQLMPSESFIYVGDTARLPYGEKSTSEILKYAMQMVDFLQGHDVKLIIVACGTVSSTVMDELCEYCKIPIIDVVRPGIEFAIKSAKDKLAVIATAATVRGGFFQQALKGRHLQFEVRACPLFVPLIENGMAEHPITVPIAKLYLSDLTEADTIVLGCTHYPLITHAIKKAVASDTKLIDMSLAAVKTALTHLETSNMSNSSKPQSQQFYVSGNTSQFDRQASKILKTPITSKKIFWSNPK